MNAPFLVELTRLGLSGKEAAIYVAVLELQDATAHEISKRTSINRSTVYALLEGLLTKGFVEEIGNGTVQKYVAASPDTLFRYADQAAKKYRTIKTEIESIIPGLKSLYKDKHLRPITKIFEGKIGLINFFEDSLNCTEKTIRVISSVEKMFMLLPDYFPSYLERRVKCGIQMISIHPNTEMVRRFIAMDAVTHDAPVLIEPSHFKPWADIAIYDDRIAYMSAEGNGYGIIIQSQELAQVMKGIFDLAYKEAKRLSGHKIKRISV